MDTTGGNAEGSASGSGLAPRRSRKTTDMTSDQVTKKRAMDRQNQRTYRAKNKAHVRCLEDKIAELSYRLTEAEDRVRRQADVIRRLGGSEELSSIQEESASPRSTVPSAPTPGGSSLAATHGETPPVPSQGMPLPFPTQRAAGFSQDVDLSLSSGDHMGRPPQPHDLITMGDFEQFLDNVGLDFGGPLAPNLFAPSQVFNLLGRTPFETNTFLEPGAGPSAPTLPHIYPHPSESNAFTTPNAASTSVVVDSHSSSASDSDHHSPDSLPPWKRMIMHTPPSSHLEEIIINSSRAWRTRFLQTAPPENGSGSLDPPRLPGIASLLNRVPPTTGLPPATSTARHSAAPNRRPTGAPASAEAPPGEEAEGNSDGDPDDGMRQGVPRPLSLALAAHVERSPYKQLTERIALTYKLSYLLRWMVCQTRETFEAMPAYMRPTQLQMTVPHPAWIDAITWPGARDAMIRAGARTKRRREGEAEVGDEIDRSGEVFDWAKDFELFQQISGRSTSVGWPYPDSGAFIESADGQYLMLHPLFETHIRKAENWTCAPEMARVFPLMAPFARDVE